METQSPTQRGFGAEHDGSILPGSRTLCTMVGATIRKLGSFNIGVRLDGLTG